MDKEVTSKRNWRQNGRDDKTEVTSKRKYHRKCVETEVETASCRRADATDLLQHLADFLELDGPGGRLVSERADVP